MRLEEMDPNLLVLIFLRYKAYAKAEVVFHGLSR